ncbi:uncharacterized protein H6S33_001773 [Morchella sextelata]|uniref:uncharacterized protein n=1 Tax=Morchella sextelata TaxID=1174677 RepID=UPI001D03B44E|nr:uncharacterized protein H6S33_001773 [Morchella sextelata]KAH0608639.1 hypothetical protein H6S33_001773 [Morchella sextelata]
MSAPPWRSGGSSYTNGSNRNGAYTQVNARKTLSSGTRPGYSYNQSTQTQTQASAESPSSGQKTTFPDKLKQYVARTFEDCPPESKSEVEVELKRIITDAFNQKVVWTIEWDNMPLPQHVLAKKAQEKKDRVDKEDSTITMQELNNSLRSPPPKLDTSGRYSPSNREPKYNNVINFELGGKKRKSASSDEISLVIRSDDRFDKRARHDTHQYSSAADKLSQRDKEKRAKRFEDSNNRVSPQSPHPSTPIDNGKILVGTCEKLEKQYFRLTSAPDPTQVRPLHVLEKTLELLKKKWRTESNYSYICDQFKSLRQDLTVQHIKTDFTVLVYEIHARIALEKGDLGEYNQCQTQLYSLYGEGFKGHEEEFKAYRILYLLHTCNRADMNDLLANLTPVDKQDKSVQHALQVRSVLAAGNFHRFFKLYLEAPKMGGYLMDSFIARERMSAMCTICKAYRPDIDIRFLTEELGFESDTECVQFLCDSGAQDLIEQKSDDKGVPRTIRFQTTKALSIFEELKKSAFKKVDIKGQL